MKRWIWTLYLCLMMLMFGCSVPSETLNEKDDVTMEKTEMTEQEKELMKKLYAPKGVELIKAGTLSDEQKEHLRILRKGEDFLKERYPEASYEIASYDPGTRMRPENKFYISDEAGVLYKGILEVEEGTDTWKDNFYGSVYRLEFDSRAEQIFKSQGYEVRCVTEFSTLIGDAYKNIKNLDDLLNLQEKNYRITHVFTTQKMDQSALDQLKELFIEAHLNSAYSIFTVPEDQFGDVSVMDSKRAKYEYAGVIDCN